jgi:hypothetical protein
LPWMIDSGYCNLGFDLFVKAGFKVLKYRRIVEKGVLLVGLKDFVN